MEKLIRFFKDEEGVTSIEYALIAALLAVGIVVAVTTAGEAINDVFLNVAEHLEL